MSRIPAAYTALTTIMVAALPDVVVRAGRTNEEWTKPAYLFVGCQDPTIEGPWVAVEQGQQEYIDLGGVTKKETFRIWMSLAVSSGSSDFASLLATALGYTTSIESALRMPPGGTGDAQLGGVIGPTGWCNLSVGGFTQFMNSSGSGLIVPFILDCVTYN